MGHSSGASAPNTADGIAIPSPPTGAFQARHRSIRSGLPACVSLMMPTLRIVGLKALIYLSVCRLLQFAGDYGTVHVNRLVRRLKGLQRSRSAKTFVTEESAEEAPAGSIVIPEAKLHKWLEEVFRAMYTEGGQVGMARTRILKYRAIDCLVRPLVR